MRTGLLAWLIVMVLAPAARAAHEDPRQIVRQTVETELAANRNDHSRWLYYDFDRKPGDTVRQWVAETGDGDLHRVLAQKGRMIAPAAQREEMEHFISDSAAQARQRKSGEHDDTQSEDMLRLLPDAFTWSIASEQGGTIRLHFAPDPRFKPPSWDARVFAAMEGDLTVDAAGHRIAGLRGQLVRGVRFCGGLCGSLSAGGTFDVERRQIGPSIWQIVETHVHIHGTALLFKNISEDEDDQKTDFRRLPGDISLSQAEAELLKQNLKQNQEPPAARGGR